MTEGSVWRFLHKKGIRRYHLGWQPERHNHDEAESAVAADDDSPIARILRTIMEYAVRDGATHIHIEAHRLAEAFYHRDEDSGREVSIARGEVALVVRYRIDGVLHEQMKVPQYVMNPLVSRIKIMADMNIAERRVPQDGRIHIKIQEKDYDLRVSTCPTAFGEKVVMEIETASD